jgi:uncharacterized RDD family membrane protein YckC
MTASLDTPAPLLTPQHESATALLTAPGLGRRMACWVYEGLLMFGVAFISDYLFSTMSQTRNALDNRHAQQAFLFVVFGIYFTWFWAKGQTLAMKTWDIRVAGRDGKSISQRRAFVRYALSWLWFLPSLAFLAFFPVSGGKVALITIGWIVFWALASRLHPQGQFLHDALAGTRLVTSAPLSR